MRQSKQKPSNRAPAPAPAKPGKWYSIENLAEPGFAEIKLRGLIGEPRTGIDFWTGEQVTNPDAAGTLGEFENDLLALGNVDNLQVSIFSQGGDWATGVAIHNLIVRHPAKNKVAIIDGLCASAATYAAMACHEIRIPSNATMLVHEARGAEWGTADELRDYADNLETISNSIAELYAARSGKSAEEMRSLMKEDRYITGQEAKDLGLADVVIEPIANLASRAGTLQPTNCLSLDNAPGAVLAFFDMAGLTNASRANSRPMKPPMLLNAASETNNGGGAATPPPVAPAAPTAPVAPPAPTAPVNSAPAPVAQPDLAALIAQAVTAAVAPLNAQLQELQAKLIQGVTAENLGGAQPVIDALLPETPPAKPDFTNLNAQQLISLGRQAFANKKKTA